jgi:uncharacterized protein YdhG (YjbR/CyaY superfamily)
MSVIDDYLGGVAEPQRSVLVEMRRRILEVIPNAEECISYRVPCFKIGGKGVAGFAAYKQHNSYFPFSGQVFKAIPEITAGFTTTSGALHFNSDEPLDLEVIRALINTRMEQILRNGR